MILTLRQAIVQRVSDKTEEELADVIEGSIGHDEKALPGLGVLFEIIWEHSDENVRNSLVNTLCNHLPKNAAAQA